MNSNVAAKRAEALRVVHERLEMAVRGGLIRLRVEGQSRDSRTIGVRGRDLLNYGSCAYLGLNTDQRLIDAAKAALDQYGPVFSSSTAYASIDLYTDLEDRLGKIFDQGHILVPTTTTLGHLSVLPVLVSPDDLVLLDHQVHASVQLTAGVLRGMGADVRNVPHNDVEALYSLLSEEAHNHNRAWFLADGVYSMFGDTAPVKAIAPLLDEFENLHLYYDDAHGVGWRGHHGVGHVLTEVGYHPRMIIIGSLAKSWGAGGSVLVLPNQEMAERVLLTGATFTFSGPLHPAELGAAVAAADIHLSTERDIREEQLSTKIDYVRDRLVAGQLPALSLERTPLWYVRTGRLDNAIELGRRMMRDDFYVNVSGFPVVPVGMDGIRFTTTLFQTDDDLVRFMDALERNIEGLVVPLEWHIELH
ncbi:MAG: aminotransferase class I/II-fold pyridoxal phosphate-dependent enzyme [Acidimicrobiia bacterium]|nr:aminotransferase class I/II-fold pyridoxal phosphate-dependent enzyme [Acidimicrobiia bacterium]